MSKELRIDIIGVVIGTEKRVFLQLGGKSNDKIVWIENVIQPIDFSKVNDIKEGDIISDTSAEKFTVTGIRRHYYDYSKNPKDRQSEHSQSENFSAERSLFYDQQMEAVNK